MGEASGASRNPSKVAAAPDVAPTTPRAEPLEPRTLFAFGALDPALGVGNTGFTVADISGTGASDIGTDVATQREDKKDKIIVLSNSALPDGQPQRFVISRFFRDGTPDPSFGTNGRVVSPFDDFQTAVGLVVTRRGKILVGGNTSSPLGQPPSPSFSADFAVARFNKDGSLDTSYGTNGKTVLDSGGNDIATAVASRGSGREGSGGGGGSDQVFIAGTVLGGAGVPTETRRVAVAAFSADGSPDARFNGGVATADFGQGNSVAEGLAVTSGGKVVVAGSDRPDVTQATGTRVAVARFRRDGTLDPSFAEDGLATADVGAPAVAKAVAVRGERIVAAGNTIGGPFASSARSVLVQFENDGDLDFVSVGGAPPGDQPVGHFVTDVAFGRRENEIYVGGHLAVAEFSEATTIAGGSDRTDNRFALTRYTRRGAPDPAFGPGGMVTTDLSTGAGPPSEFSAAIFVQRDDRVLLAGSTVTTGQAPSSFDTALLRYTDDEDPDVPEVRLDDERLEILGGEGADVVSFRVQTFTNGAGGPLEQLIATVNGSEYAFDADDVNEIYVTGRAGSDSLSAEGAVTSRGPIRATLAGGSGNDTIRGGPAPDRLFGEGDEDTIFAAGGGPDFVRGGDGRDLSDADEEDERTQLEGTIGG